MKKLIFSIFFYFFFCNISTASMIFYEDYPFHAELVTDISLSDVFRKQKIQAAFPSPLNQHIPIILEGMAYYHKIGRKSYVELRFNELSFEAEKYVPAEIRVLSLNSKIKLKNSSYELPCKYLLGMKQVNSCAKEVMTFPINRFKYNPTIKKPTKNTFIVLLEPVYFFAGGMISVVSPVLAPLYMDKQLCDIPRGTIIEFDFLKEIHYSPSDDL